MIPIDPPTNMGRFLEVAKSQDEYNTLPARYDDASGVLTTAWELTKEERENIANGKPLYLEIYTFGHAIQPILLWVEGCEPIEKEL